MLLRTPPGVRASETADHAGPAFPDPLMGNSPRLAYNGGRSSRLADGGLECFKRSAANRLLRIRVALAARLAVADARHARCGCPPPASFEYFLSLYALMSQSPKANPEPAATGFDPQVLIETHQVGVWRYLRAIGCRAELADDITQETFLAVLQKPFDDYDPKATAAYLRKVARNLFVSAMRRSGRMIAVEGVEQIEALWTRWTADDDAEHLLEKLKDCLGQPTERARWALQMRFRDRLPRVEIAHNLGITEHGAKNLMQRAKKQLRKCIETKTD